MNIEMKLREKNINLPKLPKAEYPFAPGVVCGNIVYLSGQVPAINGKIEKTGIVGDNVNVEEAEEAAVICTLNLLSTLKDMIGDLNKVKRIINVKGYVASKNDFIDQPKVINAASNLLNEIFGTENKHARVAIGVAVLPLGAPVEIEMIVELEQNEE